MSAQGKSASDDDASSANIDEGQVQGESPLTSYDFYSDERGSVIARLKDKLEVDEVPASFWALLQVCDLKQLEKLVEVASIMPEVVLTWVETCSLIPKKWNQKFKGLGRSGNNTPSPVHKRPRLSVDTQFSSPGPSPSGPSPPGPSTSAKHPKPVSRAKQRDRGKCILTKNPYVEGAHIFPCSLLDPVKTEWERAIPNYWKLLRVFWPEEKINAWRSKIFSDDTQPGKIVDGAFNVITLSPNCHTEWAAGEFGLRPISGDENELKVEFLYLPKVAHGHHDPVPLLQRPIDTRTGFPRYALFQQLDEPARNVENGDVITIKTDDPVNLPLPHRELLDMHWHLNAVVALSAAAEDQDLSFDHLDNESDAYALEDDKLPYWPGSYGSEHNTVSPLTTPLPLPQKKVQATTTQSEMEAPEEVS